MPEEEALKPTLKVSTFQELFDTEVLPSGHRFELMPDTIEVALKIAEVADGISWKKKALQAHVVAKKVGPHDVQEQGPQFVHSLLDADVTFLSLAWSAQMNGMALNLDEGVPCPMCATPFKKIDMGGLKIHSRSTPAGGPDGYFEVKDIPDEWLPKSIQSCTLMVMDPTWQGARQKLPESSWTIPEAVMIRRMAASLYAARDGGGPRGVTWAEFQKISAKAIPNILKVMNAHLPHFEFHLDMECENCREVAVIPFEQGL